LFNSVLYSNERSGAVQRLQRRHKVEFQFRVGRTAFWSISGLSLSYHRATSVWNIE